MSARACAGGCQCEDCRLDRKLAERGLVNYQRGCVCPPTSEQTCQSPLCPRKNPFAQFARSSAADSSTTAQTSANSQAGGSLMTGDPSHEA